MECEATSRPTGPEKCDPLGPPAMHEVGIVVSAGDHTPLGWG
jgi:hypothetical protein